MEERESVTLSLRAASGPELGPHDTSRVADAAWRRAQELRASAAPRTLRLRRASWAAAAAGLVGAAVLTLHGYDPAFAVEGEPVRVWDGGGWDTSRSVPVHRWVHAATAGSVLRGPEGARIAPRAGSLFRIVQSAVGRGARYEVQFEEGGAAVAGDAISVELGDEVRVERRGTGSFQLSVALEHDTAGTTPRVEVTSGLARVFALRTGETLEVGASEAACLVPGVAGSQAAGRLAMVAPWTPEFPRRFAFTAHVTGAQPWGTGGVRLLLRGTDPVLHAVEVPAREVFEAVHQMNAITSVQISLSRGDRDLREYVHEKDGRRTKVVVHRLGASLESEGSRRDFPSLAELRRQEPEAAALFGDHLPQ